MPEVQARYGILTVPDVTNDVIGKFLEHYGEWAWDEARFVASMLPQNASVLDVGAYLGTFGLGVAANANLRRVCFVEANNAVIEALQRNVQRNARVPAAVYEALVKGDQNPPDFGRGEPGNLGSTSFSQAAGGDSIVASPAVQFTLGDLRAKEGPFDLIKLDVEGMEAAILQADADFLALGETAIWVECNEDARSIDTAELLLSWGLDVYYFAFPSHNPDNLRGAANPIFPLAYEAGLLAGAKTIPVLDDSLRKHGCILQSIWSSKNLREIMWRTPRWGMPDWQGQPVEQLAALAGHMLRGESFSNYLEPGWASEEMIWERADRLQCDLEKQARETDLKLERQALEAVIHLEQQAREAENTLKYEILRRKQAEEALAETATLGLDRLSTIGQLREDLAASRQANQQADSIRQSEAMQHAVLLSQAEAARLAEAATQAEIVAFLEAETMALRSRLDATLNSTTWRLARRCHRIVESVPYLRRVLGRGRRALRSYRVPGDDKRISGQ